jgi:hypothetical protein
MNAPMSYFNYRGRRPYSPSVFWYYRGDDKVDWNKVSVDYDYILIAKPFDPSRIMDKVALEAENASGALLRIVK